MSKSVVLNFSGKLHSDRGSYNFKTLQVGAEIRDENDRLITSFKHQVSNLIILELYQKWKRYFLRLSGIRYEVDEELPTTFDPQAFKTLSSELNDKFVEWLETADFSQLDTKLSRYLNVDDEIRLTINADDKNIQRLPWHLWSLFKDYPNADFVFRPQNCGLSPVQVKKERLDILAILGNSSGIDIEQDKREFDSLPGANVEFLSQPKRREINDALWDKPCDLLFFAGHSKTENDKGRIYINEKDSLSIEDLKYGLRKAIKNGLQLAIFNSCDGLGLAWELSELNIPTIIVMREPVPDRVAQEFLKYFLKFFSNGSSFQEAFREARERLHGLEEDFPNASWLPVVFHNPTAKPIVWDASSIPEPTVTPNLPNNMFRKNSKVKKENCMAGEKFLFEKLSKLNEDNFVFLDHRLPSTNRKPDILIFNRHKGILVIEVKDNLLETIKEKQNKLHFINNSGIEIKFDPLDQATKYAYDIDNLLKKESCLRHETGDHAGGLKLPWTPLVFLYNINRQDLIDRNWLDKLGSDNVICRDEVEALCSKSTDIFTNLENRSQKIFRFRQKESLDDEQFASVVKILQLPVEIDPSTTSDLEEVKPPKHSYSIGLDFGTTNSVLSYIDSDNPKAFSYGGAGKKAYIPSYVSYKTGIQIGTIARKNAAKKSKTSYGNFKMHLPLEQGEYESKGYVDNNPESITRDFIRKLLVDAKSKHSFITAQGAINNIVVSVPELWLKEPNHHGRKLLQKIVEEELKLKKKSVRLVSEPAAAAAYYIWKTKEDLLEKNLLVCDMGGGTFDVTLCRIRRDDQTIQNYIVEVIVNSGRGNQGLEDAGVAFDRFCVKKAIENNQENIKEEDSRFNKLLREFEETKIDSTDYFNENIAKYLDNKLDSNFRIYEFEDENENIYYVTCEQIIEAFKTIKEGVEKTMTQIKAKTDRNKMNIDSLIFVGGFGQYYLVQKTILDFLNWKHNDPRIAKDFSLVDTAHAISYGACLLANKKVDIVEKYPHTVGVYLTHYIGRNILKKEENFYPIIKPDNKEYPHFLSQEVYILNQNKINLKLGIQFNSEGENWILPLEEIIELSKDYSKSKIGMALDASQFPQLILRSANNKDLEKIIDIGDIYEYLNDGTPVIC